MIGSTINAVSHSGNGTQKLLWPQTVSSMRRKVGDHAVVVNTTTSTGWSRPRTAI